MICALFHLFRCFVDCGSTVSASNKFRVTSECPNSACNGSVYEWHLEKLEEDTAKWMNVAILPNMTSTGVTSQEPDYQAKGTTKQYKVSFESCCNFSLWI